MSESEIKREAQELSERFWATMEREGRRLPLPTMVKRAKVNLQKLFRLALRKRRQ